MERKSQRQKKKGFSRFLNPVLEEPGRGAAGETLPETWGKDIYPRVTPPQCATQSAFAPLSKHAAG